MSLQALDELPSSNEGRETAGGCRFEPARRFASAKHDMHRLVESGAREVGRLARTEEMRIRPQGVGARQHLPRRRALRQAGRHVRNIADEVEDALFDIPVRNQRRTGVNAGMHAQRQNTRWQPLRPHGADLLVNLQRRVDRPASIVLTGRRMTEHDRGAVALHARNDAATCSRRDTADLAQFVQQRREVFCFHLPRERSRTDEVREEDRQSTACARRLSGGLVGAHLCPGSANGSGLPDLPPLRKHGSRSASARRSYAAKGGAPSSLQRCASTSCADGQWRVAPDRQRTIKVNVF